MTPELLALVEARFGIESAGARDLGGSSNLNVIVGDWVVRVYRPYVTVERVEALQKAREHLRTGGVPCPELRRTTRGPSLVTFQGRVVEVERFIPADLRMDSWERLEKGLPLLGRVHSLLSELDLGQDGAEPPFANHVAPEDAVRWARAGAERMRAWNPSDADVALASATERLAEGLWDLEEDLTAALPRQIVHGDFWDNNVLFAGDQVALLTDFDFMGRRARIDDLALTLYFTNSTFSDDQVSPGRIARLRRLVDAYDSGLDSPLTVEERAALPLAVARQPLWGVGRWMALLDDEATARGLAGEMHRDVGWALELVQNLDQWQEAFGS
jgi:homoserine kinase type II